MRLAAYRAILCLTTALMLVQSWPLWVGTSDIARVPFVVGTPYPHTNVEWLGMIAVLVGLVGAAIGYRSRWFLSISVLVLGIFVLFDQERLQAWVYQFILVGSALACLPEKAALVFARGYLVTLYIHSGLSKLDAAFIHELGPVFLGMVGYQLGFDPGRWRSSDQSLAILAMPVFELSIGLGLIGGQFRAMARVGSILLHLILIAILGPWGLNHSVNVLIWNGAILVGNLILFTESRFWNFSEFRSRLTWPWIGLMVAAGVLPVFEPWGLFDTWPSHGLYASHAERTELFIHEDDLENWPKSIRDHVEDRADSPWIYLNLNGLSRSIRGVPLYPQSRATHAVAEDLADRHGGPHPVRILHWGHADRWTGRRFRTELIGSEAIRRYPTQYWLNAHPSRGRPDAPAPG